MCFVKSYFVTRCSLRNTFVSKNSGVIYLSKKEKKIKDISSSDLTLIFHFYGPIILQLFKRWSNFAVIFHIYGPIIFQLFKVWEEVLGMIYKIPSFSNLIVGIWFWLIIFISNIDYQLIEGCFTFWNITHFLEFRDFLEKWHNLQWVDNQYY